MYVIFRINRKTYLRTPENSFNTCMDTAAQTFSKVMNHGNADTFFCLVGQTISNTVFLFIY